MQSHGAVVDPVHAVHRFQKETSQHSFLPYASSLLGVVVHSMGVVAEESGIEEESGVQVVRRASNYVQCLGISEGQQVYHCPFWHQDLLHHYM